MNHDTTITHSPAYMNLSCPQCRREYDVRRATDPLFVEGEDHVIPTVSRLRRFLRTLLSPIRPARRGWDRRGRR